MNKFLAESSYLEAIRIAIEQAQKIDVAVAFWGDGSDLIFRSTTVDTRIICNLKTGGTNPQPIKHLLSQTSVQIKQLNNLHAKILLTDKVLISGSANFSTNGLHLQGRELEGWEEAAIATDDPDTLANARIWFEQRWKDASNIKERDLDDAKHRWDASRRERIIIQKRRFEELSAAEIEDRNIFLALWQEDESAEARKTFDMVKNSINNKGIDKSTLSFYENWESLPQDAFLINIKVGKRGGAKAIGKIYKRYPDLDPKDKKIQIVVQCKDLESLPFSWDHEFKNSLRQRIKKIHHTLFNSQNFAAPQLSKIFE